MNPRRHSILLAVFLACLPCPLLNAAEKAVADGVPVLGAGGLWRKCYVFFPPKVTEAAARELKIDPKNTAARQAAITWRQLRGSAYSTPL